MNSRRRTVYFVWGLADVPLVVVLMYMTMFMGIGSAASHAVGNSMAGAHFLGTAIILILLAFLVSAVIALNQARRRRREQ